MSISQKKTCSLLSGCCVSSIFNLNQVIELDLGFATTLVNSKSPLASTDWETPEISLCFRGLLLAFQIVGDLCLLYIQLLALLVTGEFFLLSSFALGFLYLGSTLSAQLSCTNLWTTSVLHWVKVQSVLEEFFFFFFGSLTFSCIFCSQWLLLIKLLSVSQRDFPLLSSATFTDLH